MKKVLKNQHYHLLGYIIIGIMLYFSSRQFPESNDRILFLTARKWILFSWILAAIHQGWVLFFWRFELYAGKIRCDIIIPPKNTITKRSVALLERYNLKSFLFDSNLEYNKTRIMMKQIVAKKSIQLS